MKRHYKYELRETVPCLSWLMQVSVDKSEVLVKHGTAVECRDGFFVAGVWSGEFTKGEIDKAECSCCSGSCMSQMGGGRNALIVTTPSHLQEALYSYRSKEVLYFSNSLAWLLVETGQDLDENYYDYEGDLCSILYGEFRAKKHLPLKNGHQVGLHRNCNVAISRDLALVQTSKCRHQPFSSYEEYTHYIERILQSIVANATDAHRACTYGMISTISQGYDATATSAFAYMAGCREVMTIREPADDNGTDIAKQIGYEHIYLIERDAYKSNHSLLEAEAAATGSTAGIINPHEQYCAGKLIFMGDRGDSVWERMHSNVNDNLDFHIGNGYSQATLMPTEYLMRTRSVIIGVPLIGADSWSYIARISNSDELKAWSVGDKYDRPIPRRLVESFGVSRESFGRQKAGAGISYHFNTFSSLRNKMSEQSFMSLYHFRKTLHRRCFPRLKAEITFYSREAPTFINYILNKAHLKIRIKENSTGCTSSPLNSLLFLWGIHEMKTRYIS